MNIESNSSTGYILKAGLEYPQELNNIHNDYPLALDNPLALSMLIILLQEQLKN